MKRALFAIPSLLLAASLLAPSRALAQDTPKPADPKADPAKPDSKPADGKDGKTESKPADPPAPPPAPPGGRNRGGRGGRGPSLDVAELKTRCSLTDDQEKSITAMNEETRTAYRAARTELQNDPTKLRDKSNELRDQLRSKARGALTEEQKPKFDAYLKEQDDRQQNRGGRGQQDPAARRKQEIDRIEKALTLSSEEKAAVLGLIEKVLDARSAVRTEGDKRRRELDDFTKKAPAATEADKAAISAKLGEFRKAAADDRKKLDDARNALREVLTVENEAKLVGMGFLD